MKYTKISIFGRTENWNFKDM